MATNEYMKDMATYAYTGIPAAGRRPNGILLAPELSQVVVAVEA